MKGEKKGGGNLFLITMGEESLQERKRPLLSSPRDREMNADETTEEKERKKSIWLDPAHRPTISRDEICGERGRRYELVR